MDMTSRVVTMVVVELRSPSRTVERYVGAPAVDMVVLVFVFVMGSRSSNRSVLLLSVVFVPTYLLMPSLMLVLVSLLVLFPRSRW